MISHFCLELEPKRDFLLMKLEGKLNVFCFSLYKTLYIDLNYKSVKRSGGSELIKARPAFILCRIESLDIWPNCYICCKFTNY